jgi:hypothetical protein
VYLTSSVVNRLIQHHKYISQITVDEVNVCRLLVGKPEGRKHLKDLGIDGRIILKRACSRWHKRALIGFMYLTTGPSGILM